MANADTKGKRDEMRILTEEQAVALRDVLGQKYIIHADCQRQYYNLPYAPDQVLLYPVQAPALCCQPFDLVNVVMSRLLAHGVPITSVRLNGGAASHVLLNSKIEKRTFNDLDVVFMLAEEKSLSEFSKIWDTIRSTIMGLLREYVMGAMPDNPTRQYLRNCSDHVLEQIYVQKLIMIPKMHHDRESMELGSDEDCWSLICFRNDEGKNVEFKFVNRLRRCYEFPTDSFQIILNEEVLGGRDTPGARVGESAKAEAKDQTSYVHKTQYLSCHTSMDEALGDLRHNRLGIHKPEEIRGGGFLRYIQLRMKGALLRKEQKVQEEKNERLMLNRFLLDFRSQASISHVLDNFIRCHFPQKTNLKNMNASIEFLDRVKRKVEKSRNHKSAVENDNPQTLEFLAAVSEHRYRCSSRKESFEGHLRAMEQFHHEQRILQERRNRPRGRSSGSKKKRQMNGGHHHRHEPQTYVLEPRFDHSRSRHPQMVDPHFLLPPPLHYQFSQQVRWPLRPVYMG